MDDDVTPTSGRSEITQMLLNAYRRNRRQAPYAKAETKPRIDPRELLKQVATDPKYETFWSTTLEWTTESGEFGHVSDNEFALILIEGLAREFHRAEIISEDELTERLLLISQVRAALKVTEPEPDKITTPIFDIEFPAAAEDPTVSTEASFPQLDGVDTEVVPYSEVTNMMEEITTGHNVRPSRKVHDTIGNLLKTNLTYGVEGMSFSAAFEKIFFLDNWYGKLLFKMLAPGDLQGLLGRSSLAGMVGVPFMNDHNRMWKAILEAAKTTGPRGHPMATLGLFTSKFDESMFIKGLFEDGPGATFDTFINMDFATVGEGMRQTRSVVRRMDEYWDTVSDVRKGAFRKLIESPYLNKILKLGPGIAEAQAFAAVSAAAIAFAIVRLKYLQRERFAKELASREIGKVLDKDIKRLTNRDKGYKFSTEQKAELKDFHERYVADMQVRTDRREHLTQPFQFVGAYNGWISEWRALLGGMDVDPQRQNPWHSNASVVDEVFSRLHIGS